MRDFADRLGIKARSHTKNYQRPMTKDEINLMIENISKVINDTVEDVPLMGYNIDMTHIDESGSDYKVPLIKLFPAREVSIHLDKTDMNMLLLPKQTISSNIDTIRSNNIKGRNPVYIIPMIDLMSSLQQAIYRILYMKMKLCISTSNCDIEIPILMNFNDRLGRGLGTNDGYIVGNIDHSFKGGELYEEALSFTKIIDFTSSIRRKESGATVEKTITKETLLVGPDIIKLKVFINRIGNLSVEFEFIMIDNSLYGKDVGVSLSIDEIEFRAPIDKELRDLSLDKKIMNGEM